MKRFLLSLMVMILAGVPLLSQVKLTEGFNTGASSTAVAYPLTSSTNTNLWTSTVVNGNYSWSIIASGSATYPTPGSAPDGSAGVARMYNYLISSGLAYALVSPVIDMSDRAGKSAIVSFYFYRGQAVAMTPCSNLQVFANTTNSLTGATLLSTSASISTLYTLPTQSPVETASGWYKYTFIIPASFTGSTYILINGTSDYENCFYIDNVVVEYPIPMTYNTSYAFTPTTSSISGGTAINANQAVLGVKVTNDGAVSPYNLTSITFNTNGSINLSNIVNAKLWSTGASANFAATTQVGTAVVSPNGTFSFSGLTQAMIQGDNYYWLTYDIAANPILNSTIDAECTSITMSGVGGTRTPTVTAPAGSRTIRGPLAGAYNIGAGQPYTNLTDAVNDLKALGLSGNCVFSITSDVVEPAEVAMPIFTETGAGAGTYTITFKPSGGVRTISGNFLGKLISMTGTDRIVFDGRLDVNNPNETARNLVLRNMDATTGSNYTVYMNSSASSIGTGCVNVTFRNILFKNNNNLTSSNYTLYATGYDNDNMTIQNCKFETSGNGPYLSSSSTTAFWDNLSIKDNVIGGDLSADYINYRGLYCYYLNNSTIENNKIYNVNITSALPTSSAYGMYFYYPTNCRITKNLVDAIYSPYSTAYGLYLYGAGGSIIDQNKVNNVQATYGNPYGVYWSSYSTYPGTVATNYFERNVISNVKGIINASYPYAYSAYGLYITGSSTNTNTNYFQNNFISDIAYMNYSSSYFAAGIYHATASLTKLYHNTVNMYGVSPSATFTNIYKTYGLYVSSGSLVDVQNNIFSNTMTHNIAGSISYAIYTGATSYLGTCTNNNYYVSGAYGVLGYAAGDKLDIAAWKATMTNDNSRNIATSFTDNTLAYANNTMINASMVAPLLATTTDFAGEVRTANNNFIGADAITPILAIDKDINYVPVPTKECFKVGSNYQMAFTGKITGFADGISRIIPSVPMNYAWYKNGTLLTTSAKYTFLNENMYLLNVDLNYAPGDVYTANGTFMGVTVNSGSKTMKVDPADNFNTKLVYNFTPAFVCQYQNLSITANLEDPQWAPAVQSYTWKYSKDGVTYSNLDPYRFPTYNKSTLLMPEVGVAETGYYICEVYFVTPCANKVQASPVMQIKVWPEFKVDYQPETQTICENPSQKLLLSTIASGDIKSYLWFRDGSMIDTVKYPTAKTPFLEMGNIDYTISGAYTCKITLSDCQGINRVVETKPAEIYVLRATEITKQPISRKVALNGKVTFEVEAYHKGKIPPTYRDKYSWYRFNAATQKVDTLYNNTRIAGANSSIITINGITAEDYSKTGDYYYAVVEGMCGNVTSSRVTLTEPANISITSQPTNAEICEGSDATFSVNAVSSDPSLTIVYEWYKDGVKLVAGTTYMDVTTNTLTVAKAKATEAGKYFVRIAYLNDNNYIDSDQGTLKVNLNPTIATQPVNPGTVATGKDFTLTVVATDAVSYQWSKDGRDLTNETKASLTIAAAKTSDAGVYAVTVTNTCASVKSNDITIVVAKEDASGVNDEVSLNGVVSVTPNPVNSNAIVNFNLTKQAEVNITLIDATGRTIATIFNNTASMGLNKVELNTEALGLSSGVYYINMDSEGARYTTKIIVNK